jgi:hypothetical protein
MPLAHADTVFPFASDEKTLKSECDGLRRTIMEKTNLINRPGNSGLSA